MKIVNAENARSVGMVVGRFVIGAVAAAAMAGVAAPGASAPAAPLAQVEDMSRAVVKTSAESGCDDEQKGEEQEWNMCRHPNAEYGGRGEDGRLTLECHACGWSRPLRTT